MHIGQWTPSGNYVSSPCPGTVLDPKITVQFKEKGMPLNGCGQFSCLSSGTESEGK